MGKSIIEMAREAGAEFLCDTIIVNGKDAHDFVERFAALVREDEREKPCGNCYNLQERIDYLEERLDDIEQQEPLYFGLTLDHTWISTTEAQYNKLKDRFRMIVYTTPPTAALASRQMRDAAVNECKDVLKGETNDSDYTLGYETAAANLAVWIAALPVPEVQWRDIPEVANLIDALNAMLTHMGMDEDEWNKPTFDQARAAIAKFKEVNT